jgi:hypothetical protein
MLDMHTPLLYAFCHSVRAVSSIPMAPAGCDNVSRRRRCPGGRN